MKFIYLLPFIVLGLDLLLMRRFIVRIQNQAYFRYFDRSTWLLIVTIGNILGQMLYLIIENNRDF